MPEPDESRQNDSKPPRSIETGQTMHDYDLVAVSLNYELDTTVLIRMLHRSGIPLQARNRSPRHPLIIAGGVVPTINPEPIADILDAVAVGEGEPIIPEIARAVAKTFAHRRDRSESMNALYRIPGLYVPGLYDPVYDTSGTFRKLVYRGPRPEPVLTRRIVPRLDTVPGSTVIHTPFSAFPDLHLIEISRGCPRNCRFCLIPRCYEPFRIRSVDSILSESRLAVPGTRIGLLGAGAADHPQLEIVCRQLLNEGKTFSFSSLHASEITPGLADAILNANCKTLTFAPETGTEIRRLKLGKNISDEQLIEAVRLIGHRPIRTIKLYFMVGVPGENLDDIDAIPALCRKIHHVLIQQARCEKSLPGITASISCFVPKAQSFLERAPMQDETHLKAVFQHLKTAFRHSGGVTWTHDVPKWAVIQGLIARGDRRVLKLLIDAATTGKSWRSLTRNSYVNPGFYLHRKRPLHEQLPWNHMKTPLSG